MNTHSAVQTNSVAVAYSGGLDSAALVASFARQDREVWPMYVRCGLVWEEDELSFGRRFLDAFNHPRVMPLCVFHLPLTDLYEESHWSLTGIDVPAAGTLDEDVYLPGRNLLLLAKPAVACVRQGIGELAMASLAANPFADAQPEFMRKFMEMIRASFGKSPRITQPFAQLSKADVLRQAGDAPLHFALSCLRPLAGQHCGTCNKCAERKAAFDAAEVTDATVYATP